MRRRNVWWCRWRRRIPLWSRNSTGLKGRGLQPRVVASRPCAFCYRGVISNLRCLITHNWYGPHLNLQSPTAEHPDGVCGTHSWSEGVGSGWGEWWSCPKLGAAPQVRTPCGLTNQPRIVVCFHVAALAREQSVVLRDLPQIAIDNSNTRGS